MVSRQLRRRPLSALLVAALLLALPPSLAAGANRRVAISDYRWSLEDVQIDLGEHVTWYWTGPDTLHSVTGDSPNAAGIDSDPGRGQPQHRIGDTFRVDFDQPGTYRFRCKIHSTVNGTVTVSATPGDPVTEPDPVPQTSVDLKPPLLGDVRLAKASFRRPGTRMRFSLSERARVTADFFRFDRDGRRRFAGFANWGGTVGFNTVPFAKRRKDFRPRPGRYVAEIYATDLQANVGDEQRVKFSIKKR